MPRGLAGSLALPSVFHLTTGPWGRVSRSQRPACANLPPRRPSSSRLAPFPPEHLALRQLFRPARSLALSPAPRPYCSWMAGLAPSAIWDLSRTPLPSLVSAFRIPTPTSSLASPTAASFPQTSVRDT